LKEDLGYFHILEILVASSWDFRTWNG